MAVNNHVAGAVLASQQLIVGLLDTGLADHIAGRVGRVARVVEHLLANLAHVADEVGGKAVAGIEASLFVDGLQLGQFIAVGFDKGLLIGGNV